MLEANDTDALVAALLDSCCEQVLETMFFAPVLEPADPASSSGAARVDTRLTFEGKPSGAFEVDADPGVARTMAANFLGVEESEVNEQQVDEVLAEFTNMTCGSALSSLGCVEYFHLATPRTSRPVEFAPSINGVRRAFLLENGTLGVCLRVDLDGM